MGAIEEAQERRQAALGWAGHAKIALAGAGTSLIAARESSPPEAQELITALREDIKTMVGDVEALMELIRGK